MTVLRMNRTPRVLVVDNEPAICRALKIMLERHGFDVVTSMGGESALAHLRDSRFDLMLVDLRMPELRGDVLFHYAVSVQPHLARQTVFMTGDITLDAQEIIESLGCPLLLKPFDLRDVSSALWRILGEPREGAAS